MSEEKSPISQYTSQASYLRPSNTELPENYTMRDGFLFKGDTSVSLVTSGVVESAAQGVLHVDETEKYKTK